MWLRVGTGSPCRFGMFPFYLVHCSDFTPHSLTQSVHQSSGRSAVHLQEGRRTLDLVRSARALWLAPVTGLVFTAWPNGASSDVCSLRGDLVHFSVVRPWLAPVGSPVETSLADRYHWRPGETRLIVDWPVWLYDIMSLGYEEERLFVCKGPLDLHSRTWASMPAIITLAVWRSDTILHWIVICRYLHTLDCLCSVFGASQSCTLYEMESEANVLLVYRSRFLAVSSSMLSHSHTLL